MPNYEYECEICGNDFEVLQKMSDEPIKTCPKCGGKVRRLIGSFAVSFKGSGFYVNDKNAVKTKSSASSTGSCAGKSCSGCHGCKH